jgi:hypothetical protein
VSGNHTHARKLTFLLSRRNIRENNNERGYQNGVF